MVTFCKVVTGSKELGSFKIAYNLVFNTNATYCNFWIMHPSFSLLHSYSLVRPAPPAQAVLRWSQPFVFCLTSIVNCVVCCDNCRNSPLIVNSSFLSKSVLGLCSVASPTSLSTRHRGVSSGVNWRRHPAIVGTKKCSWSLCKKIRSSKWNCLDKNSVLALVSPEIQRLLPHMWLEGSSDAVT